MTTENPWLIIACFAACWPSPVAIILAFWVGRQFDLRLPFVPRRREEV